MVAEHIETIGAKLLKRSRARYVSEKQMRTALTETGLLEDNCERAFFETIKRIHEHGLEARTNNTYGLLITDHVYPDLTFGYCVHRTR